MACKCYHVCDQLHSYILHFPKQAGKKGKAGEGLAQWDSERETVLQSLVQLLQLDIRSLWSLSLVEEEFIRYSSNTTTGASARCATPNELN